MTTTLATESMCEAGAMGIAATESHLGLCRSTIYGLIRSGDLKVVKIGKRTLVLRDSVTKFLAANLPVQSSSSN